MRTFRKMGGKRRGRLGGLRAAALCLAVLLAVVAGCYNVTYEMIERGETDGLETPRQFLGIGEVTLYDKNGGQLIVPPDEDTSEGKQDSIPYNHKYRIPSAVVLPANSVLPNGQKLGPMGRVVVTGDARWGDTGFGGGADCPQKASTWTRYSDDGGKTWSRMDLSIHYDDLDMSTFQDKSVRLGVNTADPTIGRTATNRLIILSTFAPTFTGYYGNQVIGSRRGNAYFQVGGGDEWNHGSQWYLRLRKNSKNYGDDWSDKLTVSSIAGVSVPPVADSFSDDDWAAEAHDEDNAVYTYYVDVGGGEIKKASGNGTIAGGAGTGLWVDEYYYLYLDKDYKYPLYVTQLKSDGTGNSGKDVGTAFGGVQLGDKKVHCHLFMAMSPFLPWRGCNFIGMSYSDDGGVTWSKHKDITYMVRPKVASGDGEPGVFFISPTGGYLHEGVDEDKASAVGGNKRLLFSAYRANSGQQAAVFWTDDDGKTWQHADPCIGDGDDHYIGEGSVNFSETTIVGHPDGTLLAIGRGRGPRYAVSVDGGRTWKDRGVLPATGGAQYANNNLMSVTPLALSTSPTGDPLVALSCAANTSPRQDGNVFIMSIKKTGDRVDDYTFDPVWSGGVVRADITAGRYDYSNVRELPDGNLIVLWEANECNDLMLSFVEMQRQE